MQREHWFTIGNPFFGCARLMSGWGVRIFQKFTATLWTSSDLFERTTILTIFLLRESPKSYVQWTLKFTSHVWQWEIAMAERFDVSEVLLRLENNEFGLSSGKKSGMPALNHICIKGLGQTGSYVHWVNPLTKMVSIWIDLDWLIPHFCYWVTMKFNGQSKFSAFIQNTAINRCTWLIDVHNYIIYNIMQKCCKHHRISLVTAKAGYIRLEVVRFEKFSYRMHYKTWLILHWKALEMLFPVIPYVKWTFHAGCYAAFGRKRSPETIYESEGIIIELSCSSWVVLRCVHVVALAITLHFPALHLIWKQARCLMPPWQVSLEPRRLYL